MTYARINKTKTAFSFYGKNYRKFQNALATMGHAAEDYSFVSKEEITKDFSIPVKVSILDRNGFKVTLALK